MIRSIFYCQHAGGDGLNVSIPGQQREDRCREHAFALSGYD